MNITKSPSIWGTTPDLSTFDLLLNNIVFNQQIVGLERLECNLVVTDVITLSAVGAETIDFPALTQCAGITIVPQLIGAINFPELLTCNGAVTIASSD